MTSRQARDSRGFTLIELSVTMAILGILLALAVPSWQSYQTNQQTKSAAAEIVSVLRNAQARATAEETAYDVVVDAGARTLTVRRAGVVQRVVTLTGQKVRLSGVAFANTADGPLSARFTARGTASEGQLVVGTSGRNAKRTITVEGLTGRVSSQ